MESIITRTQKQRQDRYLARKDCYKKTLKKEEHGVYISR
jgi:hypothetical protein